MKLLGKKSGNSYIYRPDKNSFQIIKKIIVKSEIDTELQLIGNDFIFMRKKIKSGINVIPLQLCIESLCYTNIYFSSNDQLDISMIVSYSNRNYLKKSVKVTPLFISIRGCLHLHDGDKKIVDGDIKTLCNNYYVCPEPPFVINDKINKNNTKLFTTLF